MFVAFVVNELWRGCTPVWTCLCTSGLFTIDLHLMQLGVYKDAETKEVCFPNKHHACLCWQFFTLETVSWEWTVLWEDGEDTCVCVPEVMHWGKHVSSNFLNHLVPKAYTFMAASPYHAANDNRPGASFYYWTLLIQSSVTYTSVEKSILMKTASSVPCSCMQLQHCIPLKMHGTLWDFKLKLQIPL